MTQQDEAQAEAVVDGLAERRRRWYVVGSRKAATMYSVEVIATTEEEARELAESSPDWEQIQEPDHYDDFEIDIDDIQDLGPVEDDERVAHLLRERLRRVVTHNDRLQGLARTTRREGLPRK